MIHDMSEATVNSSMTLRERQHAATGDAIIEAYLELAHRDGAGQVSIPAVARQAGVSTRTVYRHFATKDELQTAAAFRFARRADAALDDALDADNFPRYLTSLWRDFAAMLPAVIAEHATPAGRELRATRLPASRARVAAAMPDSNAQTIDLAIAVSSSSMFLELVDRMQYSPDEAVAMVVRLLQLLIEDSS